ncbi:2832_t:CDS:2, partial [Funneliformis mosseae]
NTKTFYVQIYNNEGEPLLGKFGTYTMDNHDEFFNFLRRNEANGLELIDDISDNPNIITSLERVIPNRYYEINAMHLTAIKKGVFWTKVEDTVIENETLLAVKSFLANKFNSSVEIFPRIMYKNKQTIMEWDGVLTCKNMTFLLECKHKMTEDHIKKIVNRLNEFPEKIKETDTLEFKKLIGNKLVGVACSSFFPEELRNKSINEFGLAVVYPSGDCYKVEISGNLVC